MIRIILESPYAGKVDRNKMYARLCMRDCLMRGEAPFDRDWETSIRY